ncbi:dCTP deaminase, dUMP-forming [subsurface metagenome]
MTEKEQNSTEDTRLRRDPRDEEWKNWQGAVLLRDEIREYCKKDPKLIDPFVDDEKFLKPASYHLRLGDRCRVNGEDRNLSAGDPVLKIPRHGIATVRTLEKVNIPGFLIARWNLKVKKVYKGLVWVGSLQVDPGYTGYLFCPLYNLSNEEQRLEYRETLFTIDFVRTTKGCELWKSDPSRSTESLGALDTDRLKSAPFEQFEKMDDDIEDMRSEIRRFQQVIFIVLAIIIAAVAAIASLGVFGRFVGYLWLNWVSIGISVAAVGMAAFALIKIKSLIRRK